MSKKKINKELEFSEPNVVSVDEISYMTEEALRERSNRLELERNRVLSVGKSPLLWEVELAYIQREQSLRKARLEFHAEYMKGLNTNDDPKNLDSESKLENSVELN